MRNVSRVPPVLPECDGVPAIVGWEAFALAGASEVGSSQCDEWLCLRVRPRAGEGPACEMGLDLLRKQAAFEPPLLKLATAGLVEDGFEVRAELFVPEPGLNTDLVVAATAGLGAALDLLSAAVVPASLADATLGAPDPLGSDRLAAACVEAGWPFRKRSDGALEVALEPDGSGGTAVLWAESPDGFEDGLGKDDPSGGAKVPLSTGLAAASPRLQKSAQSAGRFRATVSLLDLEMYDSPITQRALALCLLRLNAAIRGARARVAVQDGNERVVLEAFGANAAEAAEVCAVLGSLSVGSQLASAEADALADVEISRHYLSVMGGEPQNRETAT